MTVLVSWTDDSAGPLQSGWIPATVSNDDFPKGYDSDVGGGLLVGEYSGDPVFIADHGLSLYSYPEQPEIIVTGVAGAGVLFVDGDYKEAVIQVDTVVTITATNDGPAGTWSTPMQSPTKVGYATTTKVDGDNTMTITYTFDEDGDWYVTEDLINRDLEGFSFKFKDVHFKVVK